MIGKYRELHRKGGALLMAAVCMSALVSGCGQVEEEETMSEFIPVQVQSPEAGSLTLKNEFVGTVSPEESVYVISMVSAEVLSTNVSVGDMVNAGDELCKLDSEAAELQLASAQAQYNSAAAGVNAAQVGYEIAQSQYEGTIAQLDAQMWGQKNLQIYQLQMQIENIEAGINDIYEQQDDLAKQKSDAQATKKNLEKDLKDLNDKLSGIMGSAESQMDQAQAKLDSALANMTALDQQGADAYNRQAAIDGNPVTYEEAKAAAQAEIDYAQGDLADLNKQLENTMTQLAQVEAAITSIDSGQKQLDSALEDAYRGLNQAQTVMNITQDQIYKDTEKIVDANKKTAALSLDSAAASVNSAQVGAAGAQIAIDSAEYQLDMYTLKAPISGVIEAANVKEHDFATPSTPAYIISNKDTMTVTFYVSEGIRNTLTVGQQVSVDRNGKLFDAVITEIGSMIDQTTGLFAVKCCVSAPDESMLTGCSVKVTADTYSQGNVLLIPYDAVYYDDSQPYVYVAVNGVVERRNIETGIFDEQTITVLSGLTTEDQLITSWSANLRDGALVSIQATQNATAEDAAVSEE